MKKFFLTFGFVMAMLFLTGCAKESPIEPQGDRIPYSIHANPQETRTTNDGMSTKWAEGDALSVFYAPAGTDEYSGNIQFTLSDAAAYEFTTENIGTELSGSYDWYALYPYSEKITSPYLDVSVYHEQSVTIGSHIGFYLNGGPKMQQQTGNDNMSHIAGPDYPLVGRAENVSSDNIPNVSMRHISSLVEVVVTNDMDEPITVSSISFTAPEYIVGVFAVDFSTDVLSFFEWATGNLSKVARLSVSDGEAIASGESAKFYLAVKPFTAEAGESLSIAVNNSEKTITLEDEVKFQSGTIKTLNYRYTQHAAPSTIGQALDKGIDQAVFTKGIVVASNQMGFLLKDDTGMIYVLEEHRPSVGEGDMVEVSGYINYYADMKIIHGDPTITFLSSGNEVVHPTPMELNKDNFDDFFSENSSYETSTVKYVQYSGKLTDRNDSRKSYDIIVDEGMEKMGQLWYTSLYGNLANMYNCSVKVTGYTFGTTRTSLFTLPTSVELISRPQAPETEGAGTADSPYTTADAMSLLTSFSHDPYTEVYVSGVVSRIDEVSTKYGNATYYISDDGTADYHLCVYRGLYLEGANFTSSDQIKVGDRVVVKGRLLYYNLSLLEFASGSQLISHTPSSSE